jgi:hypothetical protein
MEDVLTAHSDRVRAASEKHIKEAEFIRKEAHEAIGNAVDKFSDKMAAIMRSLDEARQEFSARVSEIAATAADGLDRAFTDNCMAISASEALMNATIRDRQHFYVTGKLPEPPKMPNVADGPALGEAANDQAPSETERAAA